MKRDLNVDNIEVTAFSFRFNGIIVKVKLKKTSNLIILGIGLQNPNNKYGYENWFSKNLEVSKNHDKVYFAGDIEHPPFKYYAQFLLVNKSLNDFYDVLFSKLISIKEDDLVIKSQTPLVQGNQERLYAVTLVQLPVGKSISTSTKDVIEKRYSPHQAKNIIKYCEKHKFTVRFTNDIDKAKNLKIN